MEKKGSNAILKGRNARKYTILSTLTKRWTFTKTPYYYTFRRIIVPIAKPIIATIAIFSFMWRWNDYLWPLIVISKQDRQTLQQALATFVGQLQINWSDLLAMTTITIIPVIAVFLAFQNFFMEGVTAGAVKG